MLHLSNSTAETIAATAAMAAATLAVVAVLREKALARTARELAADASLLASRAISLEDAANSAVLAVDAAVALASTGQVVSFFGGGQDSDSVKCSGGCFKMSEPRAMASTFRWPQYDRSL